MEEILIMAKCATRKVKRIKWFEPFPGGPFVADFKLFDIPNTVYRAIQALPDNCVAVSVNAKGGKRMQASAERSARRRGIRILWSML